MKISDGWLAKMYGAALLLYPAAFRARYGAEMKATVLRLHAESADDVRLVAGLLWDTVISSAREHLRAAGAPTTGYPVAFAVFFSGVLLVVSVTHQQILRRGADREPERIATAVQSGHAVAMHEPEEIASQQWLEGTEPFMAAYDSAGRVYQADARLHGKLPQPPLGIFSTIRARGEYKVTWQPERGIRVALVGEKLADGSFVVAGQSLLQAETRTSRFDRFLLGMWVVMLAAALSLALRAMILRARNAGARL